MIGAIEQGIIDRITAANGAAGALGYDLRKIATYGNELDGGIKSVVRQFPAVWVVFGGAPRPQRQSGEAWRIEPVFSVLVATRNRRNEEAARRGVGAKPGSYQICEDIAGLLVGQDLGLDIERIQPGAIRSVLNGAVQGADASIYALEIHTAYEIEQAAPTANIGSFQTFHVDYDIPPIGNVVAPPPAAENDAEDNQTLEGNP